MPKIAIFQYDLGIGGIQKAVINLVSNIDTEKYETDLYLFTKDDFFEDSLPQNVKVIRLPHFPTYFKLLPFGLVRTLMQSRFKAIDKEYDVAIDFNSFQCECAIGALTVKAKKRLMWIHTDVDIKLQQDKKYRILWNAFKSKFRYFDGFVPVSTGVIEPFKKRSGVTDKPFTVVGNFVDEEGIREKSKEDVDFIVDSEKINLVTVGRLCPEKGFDILIRDVKSAKEQSGDRFHLYVIGGGDEKDNLEKLIADEGMSDTVTLLGAKPNPFPYMAKADAFALTSRYEGQGIVFLEAMALGLPVIVPTRLTKYLDGVTVSGSDNVAESISKLTKDTERTSLGDYNDKVRAAIDALFTV